MPVEGAQAFAPVPMPREVTLGPRLVYLLEGESLAVARLDGLGEAVPEAGLLKALFTCREAVLSSRIEGIQVTVSDACPADPVDRARRLRDLQGDHRRRLREMRASANAMQVAEGLLGRPVVTARSAAQALGVSYPGARKVIDRLVEAGILAPAPATCPRLLYAGEVLDLME